MIQCNRRISALVVAATLVISCLLTGCADGSGGSASVSTGSTSTTGGSTSTGETGGSTSTGGTGESTSTGGTGGSTSNAEEIMNSDFTYNAQDGTFTGKDGSTITVTEPSEEDAQNGVAQVLERTYATPSEDTIEEKGTVVTAETIKQDASGGVMSVTGTYVVASTAFSQLTNNPLEEALLNEAINELNELVLAAGEGDEAGDIQFYKFTVTYRYENGKLVYATIYCQPYTEEDVAPETASIKVSYTVESTDNTATWIVDEKNTTSDQQGLSYFETSTILTALMNNDEVKESVKQQGENAIVQAQGTIKQIEKAKQGEKAKWKITESTSGNTTTYSLVGQTSPYQSLIKKVYKEDTSYENEVTKINENDMVNVQRYWCSWSDLSWDSGNIQYTSSTFAKGKYNETAQILNVLCSYWRDIVTGEATLARVQITIGTKQQVDAAFSSYNAAYNEIQYPDSSSYESEVDYQTALEEVEEGLYAELRQIPNNVIYCFDSKGVYDETIGALGTEETIEAVQKALVEQYPGDVMEIPDDASIAKVLEIWGDYLQSKAWETRNQVDNLLS